MFDFSLAMSMYHTI